LEGELQSRAGYRCTEYPFTRKLGKGNGPAKKITRKSPSEKNPFWETDSRYLAIEKLGGAKFHPNATDQGRKKKNGEKRAYWGREREGKALPKKIPGR